MMNLLPLLPLSFFICAISFFNAIFLLSSFSLIQTILIFFRCDICPSLFNFHSIAFVFPIHSFLFSNYFTSPLHHNVHTSPSAQPHSPRLYHISHSILSLLIHTFPSYPHTHTSHHIHPHIHTIVHTLFPTLHIFLFKHTHTFSFIHIFSFTHTHSFSYSPPHTYSHTHSLSVYPLPSPPHSPRLPPPPAPPRPGTHTTLAWGRERREKKVRDELSVKEVKRGEMS